MPRSSPTAAAPARSSAATPASRTTPPQTSLYPPPEGSSTDSHAVPAPAKSARASRKPAAATAAAASPSPGILAAPLEPTFALSDPDCRIYVGDCRQLLPKIPEVRAGTVDLVFADPPFNWKRAYDKWDDDMPEEEYLGFTYDWIDLCARALRPGGAFWINIPDDWAAEIVCYMKGRFARKPAAAFSMVNWCIWHYRFGQNNKSRFINSKVHTLYFLKAESGAGSRTWNPDPILELSDRATTYFDPRTLDKKDGMPAGKRIPMDVWYGQYWGRVQGNNKERRGYHDNQLPEIYLDRVIKCSSNPGDLVMDPFTGSGTTPVVARHLGRRYIGTEFSIDNAQSAFQRIQAGPIPRDPKLEASSAIFQPRKTAAQTRLRFGGHAED